MIVDAAGEHALVFNQEWAGEQNLAARAASIALTVASASDAGTAFLGQHHPHDGTSYLAPQLNQHPRAPSGVHARRPSTSAPKMMSKSLHERARKTDVTNVGLIAAGFTFSGAKPRRGSSHRAPKLLTMIASPGGSVETTFSMAPLSFPPFFLAFRAPLR